MKKMTCKEKFLMMHPDTNIVSVISQDCPSDYGYLDNPEWCAQRLDHNLTCYDCWRREIPSEENKDSIPYIDGSKIKDSGNRREFETGAVRDICEGKGRCDLMPLQIVKKLINLYSGNDKLFNESAVIHEICIFQDSGIVDPLFSALHVFSLIDSVKATWPDIYTMLLEVAKHFEDGAKKYGEYNWQKGIPTHCYIDSAIRHYLKFCRGDKDEPHDRAFVWNIMCCIWTCINKPELNDYPRKEEKNEPDKAQVNND